MSEASPSPVIFTGPLGTTPSDSESTVRSEAQDNKGFYKKARPRNVPKWVEELLPDVEYFEGVRPEYDLKSYEYVHEAAGTMAPKPLEPEFTVAGAVLPWPWDASNPDRICVNRVNTPGAEEDPIHIIDLGDLLKKRVEIAQASEQDQADQQEDTRSE
ncbi:uncharacterized protein J7T54_005362 [Emericellopsis cladophorae]|uniref:Uncharacterized protein n=1 Tax=Emericellopsis cladophorae TaxID=2686198 RepID=A0A9P9XVI3_9HYPO|nr:uncharacterized protein J7T54_005362 [Emericellopsis cladophorae]KAI6778456.1 hypothetical protein J7T54_005362 [Emericellopsis cladophorae]